MPKFFFDIESLGGYQIDLIGETAFHVINVLRHAPGDIVLLCDGAGTDYVTKLVKSETRKKSTIAKFEVLDVKKCITEPPIFVHLYQSVIKWENFDFAIQKAVEVGVSEITPIVTKRCIYKLSDVEKKTERLNRIAKSAAEQSERGIVPKVNKPIKFDDSLKNRESARFFACCDEKVNLITRLEGRRLKKADIWIGPEGDFTDQEKKSLISNNIIPFSLGPRTLRAETASIVTIAALVMLAHDKQL